MATTFRPYQPDQYFLLPPSMREWLPPNHLVYFIGEVVDRLNLEKFYARYVGDGRRNSPYHPAMMVKILIYGYATGVISSREIARHLETDVAFRVLAANNTPSHRTICRFRKEHLELFQDLFMQVVRVAQKAGLVNMGRLSIDGTKVRANASKRKAMSYQYMEREEKRLEAELKALVAQAEELDAAEDELHGEDRRGDELPEAVVSAADRASVVAEAVAEVEQADAPVQETTSKGDGPAAQPEAVCTLQKQESAAPPTAADSESDAATNEDTSEAAVKDNDEALQTEAKLVASETSEAHQQAVSCDAASVEEPTSASGAEETPGTAIPEGRTVADEIARRQKKLRTITAGKAELEARQDEADRAKGRTPDMERNPKGGRRYKRAFGTPIPRAQVNFTDSESRIMKTSQDGFQQCYNMQVVVDAKHQLIVQTRGTQAANDKEQLIPMLDAVESSYGVQPKTVLADSGYLSESNLTELEARKITGYVALGREGQKQLVKDPRKLPATARMQQLLLSPAGDAQYRKRKWPSEAPNGWIKHVLGFRQFSVRGLKQVSGEWDLVCLGVNLRRMATLQAAG